MVVTAQVSLSFMKLYRRQFGARVSPVALLGLVSFLPSVSPRVPEDYSTVIGVALDNNSLPALFFHMDDVSGRVSGCVFFGGLVSFLPSFLPSSCWMARWFVGAIPQPTVGHPTQPGLHARRDPVPLGGLLFFGGLGLSPLPLGWVRTRCLLVLILSMNLEQKRMALVASGGRDRRQKIEWLWFEWLGLMG